MTNKTNSMKELAHRRIAGVETAARMKVRGRSLPRTAWKDGERSYCSRGVLARRTPGASAPVDVHRPKGNAGRLLRVVGCDNAETVRGSGSREYAMIKLRYAKPGVWGVQDKAMAQATNTLQWDSTEAIVGALQSASSRLSTCTQMLRDLNAELAKAIDERMVAQGNTYTGSGGRHTSSPVPLPRIPVGSTGRSGVYAGQSTPNDDKARQAHKRALGRAPISEGLAEIARMEAEEARMEAEEEEAILQWMKEDSEVHAAIGYYRELAEKKIARM